MYCNAPNKKHILVNCLSITLKVNLVPCLLFNQQRLVTLIKTSIPTTPTNADDISLLEDDIAIRSRVQGVASGVTKHRRKRLKADFPWSYTRDWVTGNSSIALVKRQCQQCSKKWFSSSTNAEGWKAHLVAQQGIKKPSEEDSSTTSLSLPGGGGTSRHQQQSLMKKVTLPAHTNCIFENAVVDYAVNGDVSLRAAGEERFRCFVRALTNGYSPPSTRTILRRGTAELFSLAQPLLATYLCELDVSVLLTMDGWSNRNLKGFYVVTAHWVDTQSGCYKSLLLTILDVSCGKGVGNRVGSALFSYLLEMVGAAFLPKLLHVVTNNG
jgi:hypothetical protein